MPTPRLSLASPPARPLLLSLLILLPSLASAQELALSRVFGNGMVLQRDEPVTVWGSAAPGAELTVSFGALSIVTIADDAGRWSVTLAPLSASAEGRPLHVTSGEATVSVDDVLVGEVWVASGQSNMQWGLSGDSNWDLERECIDWPAVRIGRVRPHAQREPQDDLAHHVRWHRLAGEGEHGRVSAVAYAFAVRLHRYLGVPIGIVDNSWGGTTAETWTSRPTLESLSELPPLLAHWAQRDEAGATDRNHPAGCYNAMLWPLRHLTIRGALFYQGENNSIGQWHTYAQAFPAMIADWRAAFDAPELPFGIISLTGFARHQADRPPEVEGIPEMFYYAAIRDVHFRTHRDVPHTGLVVTTDLGDSDNIHPHRKDEVGERAARWALAQVYEAPVVHTGPIYRDMQVTATRVRLFFDLDPLADPEGPWYLSCPITRAGSYRGFAIAGADRVFRPAQARRIDRDRCLEVWSELVPEPVAVRYGWAGNPSGNVIGLNHLPAAPFRTDDWPLFPGAPYDAEAKREWEAERDRRLREAAELARQRELLEARKLLAPEEEEEEGSFWERAFDRAARARPISVRELSRDDERSQHLVRVAVGAAEPPHVHDRHDLYAYVLEGRVRCTVGDRVVEAGPGELFAMPRGVVHWVENIGEIPSHAHVIFVPPFDGKDFRPVEEK